MLTNFFKLNSPFTFFEESGRLSEYFLTSSTLENVIFKPIHIDDQQKCWVLAPAQLEKELE